MDSLWTPGAKKQSKPKGSGGLDDLLGDLLDDDVTPRKKTPTQPIGAVKPGAKKQSSKDEDFYSNLAATAEDNLSDVSEADVGQMAKTVADLEDMDADLFGGKFKKKGSIKGGSERSSKPSTPRRTGTPRSRSTTPRASSPQARVTSPTARVTSPLGKVSNSARGSSPTIADTQGTTNGISTSRQGSGKRRTGGGLSPTFKTAPNYSPIPEQKPGTAPGKMTDIGSASENLKPGTKTTERPGTVPKMKKMTFPDFDEDDPLAGLLSDEDDESISTKPKKSAMKSQKGPTEEPMKRQKSLEDLTPAKVETEESKKRSIFERPPTRSGGNTETDDSIRTAPPPAKKKDDAGIFSDDDDFLGGLGIEEKGPPAPVPKAKVQDEVVDDDEDNRPARSVMDKLLSKDSVSRHLETPKERQEFVLDKKYTNENEGQEQEDDFQFGGYQPSVVSTGSRPNSRRSVRFQDEDDIFGFDRPPSRGRSPANTSKKPDDMDWLNEVTAPPKPSPAIKNTQTSQKPGSAEAKPVKQEEVKTPDTKQTSLNDSKPIDRKPSETMSESSSTKAKSSGADWLGLNDADDEDDDAFSWMKTKTQPQKTSSPRNANDKRAEWMQSTKQSSTTEKKTTDPSVGSPADWLGHGKSEDTDDYLGLGKEVDTSTLLQKRTESPKFGQKQSNVQSSSDLFESPPKHPGPASASWQSSAKMTPQKPVQQFPSPPNNQMPLYTDQDIMSSLQSDIFETGQSKDERERKRPDVTYSNQEEKPTTGTDFFSFNRSSAEREYQQMLEKQEQHEEQQHNILQQHAHLQEMMSNLKQQYNSNVKSQMSAPPTFTPDMRSSVMMNPPKSLMEAQTKLYKVEIERDYAFSLLEMNKKRFEEEKEAIEKSYKSRLELVEETTKNKESRLREENELMLSQHLTKVRHLEEDKSELTTNLHKKIDELNREKLQDIERIKASHKNAIEELKQDHEEAMERLKKTKDLQIEAAVTSHDTTKSLVEAVGLIQTNAKDLGELQKKVDSWHSMGLDEREIALRSRDEQLRILQERLNKQQETNDLERKRLEDLISRLETQLREQTSILDEERWKVKQEQTRLQSLQTSLEEERRLWTEQQARERSNIEKTRESLLEEQKSVLSQLHKERQALAEDRTKLNVSQQLQKEDSDQTIIKLSQAKAEFEAVMRAISEEKSKSNSRKQELQREEEAMYEARRKLETDQSKMKQKEEELIEAATLLKERSEEVDEIFMESQRKFDDGIAALQEAKKIESEDQQRTANIQSQTQMLRLKEKEIAEERLRLSKDKKEVENLKSAMLCPNCRTPAILNSRQPNQGMMQQMPLQQNMIQTATHQSPAIQMSLNSVGSITESIKADRSIRMWKMEALKDQKYLEEQSMFLYTLKQMPYSSSNN